jgi:hypothetical protein
VTEPLTPEQFRQLNRSLMEKVLDKAANDPEWKQRLLDEPDAAIQEAGFPEVRRLQELQVSTEAQEELEVTGQGARGFKDMVLGIEPSSPTMHWLCGPPA